VDSTTVVGLALLFALGAALYSSVGHGGASAYIASMALFSIAPETMKPTALALNLLVAGFGAWRYWKRGLTNWKLVLAFALTATPAAFVGGGIHLPGIYYKPLVGILTRLMEAREADDDERSYLRDVLDHALHIEEQVDGFRELLPRNDTAGPVGVQELRLP